MIQLFEARATIRRHAALIERQVGYLLVAAVTVAAAIGFLPPF